VLDAPALGQQVAVGLAGEDGVDRLVQQPFHQRDVQVVDVRVLEVDGNLVPPGHDPGGRVPRAHPLAAQRQRDAFGHRAQDEDGHALALREGEVDELVVPAVRGQELAED
jgi:hypothetical protein